MQAYLVFITSVMSSVIMTGIYARKKTRNHMLAIMHAGKVHMYLGESCHFKSVRGIIARLVFPHELQYFDTNSHTVLMTL